jgi:hypothetical protein
MDSFFPRGWQSNLAGVLSNETLVVACRGGARESGSRAVHGRAAAGQRALDGSRRGCHY